MLIPLQAASGLSSSQLAVLWMATQGSGLAEKAWEITVDKIGDGDGSFGGTSIAAPDAAARQVLLSAACVETINQGMQKRTWPAAPPLRRRQRSVSKVKAFSASTP
ncbi:hypothetical protein [Azospirillum argentinense]|nr:hypothetical protein [Azospirillum argentinense]